MKKVIILFFVFLGLSFLGMGQVESDAPVRGEVSESLGFNFCEFNVDLRIYSASNMSSPVADNEEYGMGAVGVANETTPIKVEFLEISGIDDGEVKLIFELYDYNGLGIFYIWDKNFLTLPGTSTLLGTVEPSVSQTIMIDASDLPFAVFLQTPSSSSSYRDITVKMEYATNSDKARATIYPENNTPSIVIEPLDGLPYNWQANNSPYMGLNDFIDNVDKSLFAILDNNLGTYQVTASGSIEGHIINDFLSGGILSFAEVRIIEQPWGIDLTVGGNSTIISYSQGKAALKIYDQTIGSVSQEEGLIAPVVFLIHELAHAWMNVYDPRLDNFLKTEILSTKMAVYSTYGLTHDYTHTLEHDLIMEKLENPACIQLGFAVRKYYNNTISANAQQQMNILTLSQPTPFTDVFYKSITPLGTTPE